MSSPAPAPSTFLLKKSTRKLLFECIRNPSTDPAVVTLLENIVIQLKLPEVPAREAPSRTRTGEFQEQQTETDAPPRFNSA